MSALLVGVLVVLAALVVVAIGLIAVGAVTGRLSGEPPRSLYVMDEAVDFVADRLPDHLTARITYDDVRAVLGWHIDYLEMKGVAGRSDHDLDLGGRASGPIVAAEDEGVAYVLGRAGDQGIDLADIDVVEILEAEALYLRAIGAVGGEVPTPADPVDPVGPVDPVASDPERG